MEEDDPAGIIAARTRMTGTVSDRQKLSGGDFLDSFSGESPETVDAKKLVEDSYPGEEYRLHFAPGQEARFVVITPLYSEEADGDAQIMLFLKNASSGYEFSEVFGPVYISIVDEDERETVVISMESAEITAEEGKAGITVTRSGRKSDMVGIHIASWDGTAQQGEDYCGVGANLYFPMGITSRTIELPVGHGAEDKDFYVTITTLETIPGVEIGAATAHVTIPAGEIVKSTEDGQLLGLLPDSRLDGALNLQALVSSTYGYAFSFNNGGQGFDASTEADQEGWAAGMYFNAPFGYYYDGLQAKFDLYLCYSDSYVCFNVNPNPWTYYTRYYTFVSSKDDDRRTGWEATAFFGSPKYDGKMEIFIKHDDNRSLSRKCYSSLYLKSIRPIKRQFRIVVEQPEALEFKGMTEE